MIYLRSRTVEKISLDSSSHGSLAAAAGAPVGFTLYGRELPRTAKGAARNGEGPCHVTQGGEGCFHMAALFPHTHKKGQNKNHFVERPFRWVECLFSIELIRSHPYGPLYRPARLYVCVCVFVNPVPIQIGNRMPERDLRHFLFEQRSAYAFVFDFALNRRTKAESERRDRSEDELTLAHGEPGSTG